MTKIQDSESQLYPILELRLYPVADLKIPEVMHAIYARVSDSELTARAERMILRGQRTPVEILPNGTLIDGYPLVQVAQFLGLSKVKALVRVDLVKEIAIEVLILTEHLHRGRLSPLERARGISWLVENRSGHRYSEMGVVEKVHLMRTVAEELGVSMRYLHQNMMILDTPRSVQGAVDRHAMRMYDAYPIARLDETGQASISDALEDGEDVEDIVRKMHHRARYYDAAVSNDFEIYGYNGWRNMMAVVGTTQVIEAGFYQFDVRDLASAIEVIIKLGGNNRDALSI